MLDAEAIDPAHPCRSVGPSPTLRTPCPQADPAPVTASGRGAAGGAERRQCRPRDASGPAVGKTGSMATKAVLEGGPDDLPERIVSISDPGQDLKIPHRGGYEHFRNTSRHQDSPEGQLAVYEWWERTEIAE